MTYFTHDMSAPLPDEIKARLAQEPGAIRDELSRVWDLAGRVDPDADAPSDDTWRAMGREIWEHLDAATREQHVRRRAPAEDREPARSSPLRLVRPAVVRWVALAACITLLAAVGLFWWQQPITVTAPHGEIAQVTLPDGSNVDLNSGSTLAYTRSFGGDVRAVTLDGEAFFRVDKAPAPFVVQTFNGATTVLGTSFNVRAWPDDADAATTVSVASGIVRLAPRDNGSALTLRAGEAAALPASAKAPVTLEEATPENALAWREGGFKFTNVPLGTILREVERRYDVEVEVTETAMLDDPVAVLIEKSLGAEQILRDICEYNGYAYSANDGSYLIYRPSAD